MMPNAGFAWDERKRVVNFEKHGIDFRDAAGIFDGPHLTVETIRNGETRKVSLGPVAHSVIAVVGPIGRALCGSSRQELRGDMRDKPKRRASDTDRSAGQTDWDRIATLGDAEIAAAVADDPDAAPLDIDWSRAEVVMPPRKVPVSIRLDTDVLDYFKHEGAGYQSRINAVLRSYMAARIARGSDD